MDSTIQEFSNAIDPDQIDWSFEDVTTDYLTHGLHRYPARMIPQIPRTLFNWWLQSGRIEPNDLAFDPFCGSGTTPVEARLNGLNAFATDINPFACLLARTKSQSVDIDSLYDAIHKCLDIDWTIRERFIDDSYREKRDSPSIEIKYGTDLYHKETGESTNNVAGIKDGWFPHPQLSKIDSMRRYLSELREHYDYKVIRFIRIALSQAAREISYQRNGEFKRHRIPESKRKDHNPPFVETFSKILTENYYAIENYLDNVDTNTTATIRHADCRDESLLEPNSVDAICTSPPYGDHSTTVAYGQHSQAPGTIATPLPVDTLKDVDASGLGGKLSGSDFTFNKVTELSSTLAATVDELDSVDGRDTDVLRFFIDYAQSLKQMARVIKPGQPVAIVIGNRTVSRIPIPTHLITTELALAFGLNHEHTLERSIPSKALPFENAPENVPGHTGNTIADEYILIFNGSATN